MKNWILIAAIFLLAVIVMAEFLGTAPLFVGSADRPDTPGNGYLCCAIAIDTSRTGSLLRIAGFLIGFATAALLIYKIWAGVKEVFSKDTRRALRWACGFISKELLLTVDPPADNKKGAQDQSRLLQRGHIASIIKLLGEFLEAAQSGDEESTDLLRGRLGEARSELEKSGWASAHVRSSLTVYFLYRGDEDDRYPPEGRNWRATGKSLQPEENAEEYCRKLMKGDSRIEKAVIFDLVYGDWTHIYSRKQLIPDEEKPTAAE